MEALSKPSATFRNNSNMRAFEEQIFSEEVIIMIDFRTDVKTMIKLANYFSSLRELDLLLIIDKKTNSLNFISILEGDGFRLRTADIMCLCRHCLGFTNLG